MASVFEEILSDTVHFSTEPAGTSCSAEARIGAAARRRDNVSRSLLFMGDPGEFIGLIFQESGCCCVLQHSAAHLRSAPTPIEASGGSRYRRIPQSCARFILSVN